MNIWLAVVIAALVIAILTGTGFAVIAAAKKQQ